MKKSSSKERIKELMQYFQLNQTDFCQKTGIQKSALSNYLNGERLPRQDQISKIADAFNISPAWLMGYDVPMIDSVATSQQNFTAHEQSLISAYRSAPDGIKDSVCKLLDVKRKENTEILLDA